MRSRELYVDTLSSPVQCFTLCLASGGVTIFFGDYGSNHPSKVRNTLLIHEPCRLWRLRPRYRTPPAAAIFWFFFSFGRAQVHPSICRFLPSIHCYEWTFLILHSSWRINKYLWVCEFRLMSVCSLLYRAFGPGRRLRLGVEVWGLTTYLMFFFKLIFSCFNKIYDNYLTIAVKVSLPYLKKCRTTKTSFSTSLQYETSVGNRDVCRWRKVANRKSPRHLAKRKQCLACDRRATTKAGW